MKVIRASGILLAIGVLTPICFAEDVQWRPVGSEPANSSPAASPRATTQPRATTETIAPATFRSADSERPRALVRAKTDPPRPLPPGPIFNQSPIKDEIILQDSPRSNGKAGGKAETIPTPPTPVDEMRSLRHPGRRAYMLQSDTPIIIDGDAGGVVAEDGDDFYCGRRRIFGRIRDWWCTNWATEGCCYPRCKFWISAEYLLWGLNDQNFPPLVTTSPTGTPLALAGVLGAPGTTVLFDEDSADNFVRNGGRLTLGFWFTRQANWGMEASFFVLGRRTEHFSASGNGDPILARPIINADTGLEESQLVSFPGLVNGSIRIDHDSYLWGIEASFRRKLGCGPRGHVDGIIGFRHLQFEESINISEDLSALDPLGGAPTGILVHDYFEGRNRFNGIQLGLEAERRFLRRWFASGLVKVAFGNMHQTVIINGNTTFTPPGGPSVTQPGGILALGTNSGRFDEDRFTVIPEIGVKVGFHLTANLRLYAGYNLLIVPDVVRPADQIDRTINRSQIPNILGPQPLVGAARPSVPFQTTTLFAQGFNFGLEWRY